MVEFRRWGHWLKALFRPGRVEDELKAELRLHLDLEIEKNLRSGMGEREARRKALLDFGGMDRFEEQTREARPTRTLENLGSDIRQAVRRLAKAPGFTPGNRSHPGHRDRGQHSHLQRRERRPASASPLPPA